MRKALAILLSLITLSTPALAVAGDKTNFDGAVPCPGSIAIGDIVGVYAVDKQNFEYFKGSPLPARPGTELITALNAATLEIEEAGSNIAEGYLYIDQYGTRFLRLKNTASYRTYHRFGLPVNSSASPYQILGVVALPRGYQLLRCKA